MISIIIPVYNQAPKLIRTIKSLEAQTCHDFEVIIVNDGSTDDLENIFGRYMQSLGTERHYLFINQENRGAPAARNRGYQLAKGEYLFFCDADAILEPEALESMLNNLTTHPEASYVYSSFYWGDRLFKLGPFDPDRLKRMPYIHTMSLIRKSDFPAQGWDENIRKFQDWDLWLTMLANGKVGLWIPQILFKIIPGGTISAWLPSFAYSLLPFLPTVKKYKAARRVIQEKHGLQ